MHTARVFRSGVRGAGVVRRDLDYGCMSNHAVIATGPAASHS